MTPRKRLPAPERRKQILKAATKVLARSNYQAARVADIAAQVGVSEAAVYRHFRSKKEIYLEILQHMSGRIIAFWQEEVDQEPDALEALRRMGLTYFHRMSRHADELKVQFQAVAEVNDPQVKERIRADHAAYVDFIQGVIRKAQAQGRARPDLDPAVLAWLLDGVGVLMNLTNLLAIKSDFNEASVTKLIDFILSAMAAPDGGRKPDQKGGAT
ncbi:MAG: TetR/AcrR family transcriptional regulator [Thermodesulfobacteriota bacterium]